MKYPSRSEYCSSIRNPQVAFRKKDPLTKIERNLDSNLVTGKAVEKTKPDGTKDIWSASGSFVIAFKFETFSPNKVWAIRCFYRSNFEVKNHYENALIHLKNSSCRSYFVNFSFLEEGIRVQGNCYPILKMEWVEGENLKKFIKANLDNKNILKSLAALWINLSKKLLDSGIAHGDLQHGNILIVNHFNQLAIKLIDYDSLYFSGDANFIDDNIKGLPDYQHPLRKLLKKRCLEIDFFPQLVIYISILALAEDKKLWETYQLDEREGLLFKSADFQNPDQANIFKSLSKLPHSLAVLVNKLKEICQLKDFRSIPSLDTVLSDGKPQVFEQTGWIPNRQERSLSQPVNLISLWFRGIHSSNKNAPNQTGKWKFIPAINLKRNFWDKAGTRSQNPEAEIISPPIKTELIQSSTHKSLTQKPNTSPEGTVGWDPRSYKTSHLQNVTPVNSTNSTGTKILLPSTQVKTLDKKKADVFLSWVSKTKQNLLQTYNSSRDDVVVQFHDLMAKIVMTILTLVNKLKKNSISQQQLDQSGTLTKNGKELQESTDFPSGKGKREIESKTWTTPEIASQLGCSVNWCNNQRYQYPDQFHQGTHYCKDQAGMIQWTEAGIDQLRCLQSQKRAFNIPSTSLATKEVSSRLGVSQHCLTKIKAKYASNFVEGTHYHIDARKRYYWTPEGIDLLKHLLAQ